MTRFDMHLDVQSVPLNTQDHVIHCWDTNRRIAEGFSDLSHASLASYPVIPWHLCQC